MNDTLGRINEVLAQTRAEVGKVIIGQKDVLDQALVVIFTGHHALVEGVPGIAKTLLVRTLSRVLGCEFSRIQFTPDLMPADITGTNVFNLKDNDFHLVKGPLFTTFLLADLVSWIAGAPVEFDADGIDLAFAGVQKAFALPPGISVCCASQRYLERARGVPGRGFALDPVRIFWSPRGPIRC